MTEIHDFIRSAIARHFKVEFFDGGSQGFGCKIYNESAIYIGYGSSVRGALSKAFREMRS